MHGLDDHQDHRLYNWNDEVDSGVFRKIPHLIASML
jgi:hypothetical protein